MATASPNHNAVRTYLLLELSVLRDRYDALCHGDDDYTSKELGGDNAALPFSPPAKTAPLSESSDREEDTDDALGQSDRDAIEAFFNSDDDFSKDFNSGNGSIRRGKAIGS